MSERGATSTEGCLIGRRDLRAADSNAIGASTRNAHMLNEMDGCDAGWDGSIGVSLMNSVDVPGACSRFQLQKLKS